MSSLLDLTGKWEFKEYPVEARRIRDLDSADWKATCVPCSIFNSLITSGQIKQADIYTDPEKFSWVSERPWIYRKFFDVPAEMAECERVELVFEGLDTIANIWLNGKLVGKTNNMFIPFSFDVKSFLKPQKNLLQVKFEPATQYAQRLASRYGLLSEANFGNPYRVYIRKAQYQFGWDFCPALPGCGIWRAVHLEGVKKAKISGLNIRTIDCNQHYADIKITVKLDAATGENFLCRLNVCGGKQIIMHELTFRPGEELQSTVIRIERPLLWWPAGYGQPHLYELTVQLLNNDEMIDQREKIFGIRTVKLNRLSDKQGENFQFEINGQPIFARGANWVPASIFAGSVTKNDYAKLLHSAEKANINMLRVWGGGYYEAKEFYELCDELGIMVWQDFMFACGYYPDRQWFTEEVKKEASAVIKQLRDHPCLVLWCGNNEIDWMHWTGKLGQGKKFYGRAIYHQLLPQLVGELDSDTDYIPTTPLGEKGKLRIGRPITTHQWDVWSGDKPVSQYLCGPAEIPRFVTEFGLQSLPDMETIKDFCPSEQLRMGSQILEKHNYQLDGNSRLYRYVSDLFGTAPSLEQFAYLSQITQARAIKAYVEYLRAHNWKNKGTLFWQFNDCFPTISWSAMDYAKKPKALYYYAKRFFSKQLITVVPELEKARSGASPQLLPTSMIAVNDSGQPLTATLNCRLIDLFGRVLDRVAFSTAIGPFSTSAQLKLPKEIVFPAQPDKVCLHLVMDRDGEKIAENLFFYLPDKYIDWPAAEITREFSQIADKQWKLKLKSNAVAKDVQLSSTVAMRFSDNFVDLVPPDGFGIIIDCEQEIGSLESAIKIHWLR